MLRYDVGDKACISRGLSQLLVFFRSSSFSAPLLFRSSLRPREIWAIWPLGYGHDIWKSNNALNQLEVILHEGVE